MIEVWKDIDGYPNYQASNLGRVKSLNYKKTGVEKILKGYKNRNGYLRVNLSKKGKSKLYYIHRLVAQAFISNPNNWSQINHIDEDKTNNKVDNLEFCTAEYNINYGTRTERTQKPILQFSKEGEFIRKWDSIVDIERELGFNHSAITKCCKGKLYKSVGGYKWHYHYKSLWLKNHIPLKYKKAV